MYAAAALDACEQIKARMEPIASQRNFGSFAEVLFILYFSYKLLHIIVYATVLKNNLFSLELLPSLLPLNCGKHL